MARLWAIKVTQGNDDRGWLIDHGRVIAVYDDKDYAEREAKWLCDFQRKCGSKTIYEVKKWIPEEGIETAIQVPPTKKRSAAEDEMPKMKRNDDAAPAPSIPTDLSELLIQG